MDVRFGIVGLGSISNRFATVLQKMPGVKLTAVASREQARSDAFAQKYGAKKASDRYLDVITDSEVDVVYIGLTHNFHYEIAKLCLENHKAVLCEKPLVTTQKDAATLVDLARENKTLLMEALWTRCLPAFQKAKTWVSSGKIGEVKLITANFCFKANYNAERRLFNPQLAGGSLFDAGVYPIEFATGILNETPVSVTGLAQIGATGVDEAAAISLKFAGGALASLSCGFTVNAPRGVNIYGTKGHILVDECVGPKKCELFDEKGRRIERFADRATDGFVYQIRHCADLFRSGKLESDLIPLQDSLDCAAIFDDLRRQWGLIK